LDQEDYEALVQMAKGHEGKTANGLIGLLTDSNETVKWRAVKALGQVTAQMFPGDPEGVRKVIRQLIWNLNDESGGIGWGMPEALGEILAEVPSLQKEYLGLLVSYITEKGCFLENESLQTGVIWGLGRIKGIDEKTKAKTLPFLLSGLENQDPLLQGMIVWTLGEIGVWEAVPILKTLQKKSQMIKIFINTLAQEKPLGQWAEEAIEKIKEGGEIMTENEWKCSNCGYTLKTEAPPDQCPSCNQKCEFLNITCYIPECDATGSDQRLK
jgi:HEAT repeat protein/rubredoxin